MLRKKRESWEAPRRRNWPKIGAAAAIAAIVILGAALAWSLTRPAPPPPPPPPPPPTAHSLTALESAGMQTYLARFKGPNAYSMSGSIFVGKNKFGIELSQIGDRSAGVGTLIAGGTRGDMLLENGKIFLRGDTAFWSALGVTGASPQGSGWVDVGPDFLDGKLFYPSDRWTSDLAPSPRSIVDGMRYSAGTATATLGPEGITEINIPEVIVAKLGAINPPQVHDKARPLIEQRGEVIELQRSQAGRWTLPSKEEPVPEGETPQPPTP